MLEQDNISRIKILLKAHPRGLTITDVSQNLKMNRNSAAKYLEILQISGIVESRAYGTARVFFLTHRLPISALVSITEDLVVTLNENHKILFVNESFCTFFDVKKEDAAGTHIVEIFKNGIGRKVLPGIFSDIIAGDEKVHDVQFSRDAGDVFFKIKSMQTVFDDGSRGITIVMVDVTRETQDKIELETKEARYHGIVEDQTDYVVRFLPDGTLTFVNTAYSLSLKNRSEDLLGTPFSDAIHPEDQRLFDQILQTLGRENPVAVFEGRSAAPENPVRWIAWTLRVLYDHQKEPREYQAVGHDITRERMEKEHLDLQLTQMEFFSAKLQQFIELPPNADIYQVIATGFSEILPVAAVCVSGYDPETRLLSIKAIASKHDQETFTRQIGRNIVGLAVPVDPGPIPRVLLDGRILNRSENLFTLFRGGVPQQTCFGIEEMLNLGDYYSVGLSWQGTLLGSVTFSVRKGGKLENIPLAETYIRAASIALQRLRAEDALRKSERLYRSVLDNIQDVYYRSDMEGNLLMVSPSGATMLGYSSPAEVHGINIGRDLYLEPEKRDDLTAAITKYGSVSNYEVVLKKKDGTPFYIETNSHLYYDEDGTLRGIEGIFRDITERKAAMGKIHQYIGDMEFLSQKLLEFIMMEPAGNIYDKILSDLKTIVPDSTILVNSFDPHTGIVMVKSVAMNEKRREALFRGLGRDLVGCEFPIDEVGRSAFQTGRLQKGDISLFEIAFRSIPRPVCDQLEGELDLGDKYAIGFVRRGEIMGNAGIFLDPGKTIPDPRMVEMYAREAATALQSYLAEKARRESDEIFSQFAQNSPLPIAILEPDGTFQYINESYSKLFGYDLNDFHNLMELFCLVFPDPVYRKQLVDGWERERLQPGARIPFTRTFSVRCRDSTEKEVIVRAFMLSSGRVCSICEDITDKNKAEQTLRLLSSIIATTSDAVIAKDPCGTIISWNKAAERLYGYSAKEMIGQNISQIIPPERAEETERIFSRVSRGESVSDLETRRIRKDGRFVDVSVTVSPMINDAGTVTGASTIARDITRHKAEERLRKDEEQYRSLVENISVGFYRSTGDPTGRFIWGNSSLVRILGYPSFEDLSGVGIADIFVEPDGRTRLLDDLKKDGFVKNRQIGLRRLDGKTVSVLVTALARFDPGGDLSCINGIVQDITGQKQAEDHAQTMDKQMKDILTCLSDPVVITDKENRVIAWNTAMELLTCIQKAEVDGRDDYEHLLPWYDPARPALVTLFDTPDGDLERYYPGAYRQGSMIIAPIRDLVHQKELPDFFTIRACPLRDPCGGMIGAVQVILTRAPDRSTRIS